VMESKVHAPEKVVSPSMTDKALEAAQMLSIQSEHKLRQENLPFDIDVYYPKLAPYTFPSEFIPFTRAEAHAIMHYQNLRFGTKGPKLTEADVAVLKQLEERIHDVLVRRFPKGAFLRLSGRSPKDGEPLSRQQVRDKYQHELQQLLDQGCPKSANTRLRAIGKVNWMKVDSGAAAMSLLLTSERVFADLHDWLKYGEPEQIVLRQFEPELCYENEFRVFVCNGVVTAISQYDHYCVYPNLETILDRVQTQILDLFAKVHPSVGVESYVMDFAYLAQSDRTVVIEISPFLPCTGAAMFHWANDRHQLHHGPLEFRINRTECLQLEQLVEANWDVRWEQDVDHYSVWFKKALPSAALAKYHLLNWSNVSAVIGASAVSAASWLLSPAAFVRNSSIAFGSLALWLSYQHLAQRPTRHLLFFYGTLKSGFHWNTKYLSGASLVSRHCLTAERFPLVVDESGVPYLLGDLTEQGERVCGEVWAVDDITLQGLDEFEGIGKGYYSRRPITVECKDEKKKAPRTMQVQAYFLDISSATLRSSTFLREYPLKMHQSLYNPIRHILVKQNRYLSASSAHHS